MIYRIEVRTIAPARDAEPAADPLGQSVRQQIIEFGAQVSPITTRRIFLIDTDATPDQVRRIASELLADPIVEEAEMVDGGAHEVPDTVGGLSPSPGTPGEGWGGGVSTDPRMNPHPNPPPEYRRRELSRTSPNPSTTNKHEIALSRIEIHLKPGVMDPVAASTEMAIRDMGLPVKEVRTGRAYLIEGDIPRGELQQIASKVLANGVIESVHFDAYIPEKFEVGRVEPFKLKHVPIRRLPDEQLQRLSRDGHLFLSLTEMQAIQSYFCRQEREPTDIELESLAQTWSEHCVHKTLKSAVEVFDESGKLLRRYGNLIKETIFQSTKELMERGQRSEVRGQRSEDVSSSSLNSDLRPLTSDFCLSVFKDNAGVIAFDDTDAVCFKVETHNHPSAIEPYGGSATGIGGCIRDILGTGLAAKPVANTDVFCVAFPDRTSSIANRKSQIANLPGVLHPKRILQQVVAGVRDYGNRMGIPTVNGAVYFDNRYLGNPLVFCGCIGLIPRDKITKEVRAGDAIVLMGGRTGRDGIHGATFSSAELTDTHADEFSHAVQIGNAITQKKMADVILQARDRGLFNAITDLGAGGLSSAVGEMGEKTGAAVDLEKVPLKYTGLRYDEIWISEAQERMALSVQMEKVDELLKLAASEDVEATVIGSFGTPNRELILNYRGNEVGRLSMEFLHDGLPMPTRRAVTRSMGVPPMSSGPREHGRDGHATLGEHGRDGHATFKDRLLTSLTHPNIASKHWIIRQYDHEVQGGSVIKPLIGPMQIGPSDAAVVRPKLDSFRGVAIACGLAPHIEDPYDMTIASIDEAIRNAVAVGADPDRIAMLDNFCWPSVEDEHMMGTLVRACEACRDAALAYGVPFISGKDSLNNQFTNQETGQVIRIPDTLLISTIGVIEDVRKCVTMDFKQERAAFYLIAAKKPQDLPSLIATHRLLARLIADGHVAACHDVSDGGYAVAAAEMAIASDFGITLDPDLFALHDPFAETNGRYIIEPNQSAKPLTHQMELTKRFESCADIIPLGVIQPRKDLLLFNSRMGETRQKVDVMIPLEELAVAWRGTLDW